MESLASTKETLHYFLHKNCREAALFNVRYATLLIRDLGEILPKFAGLENVAKVDESRAPSGIPLKKMLSETHDALFIPKEEKPG